VPDGTQPRNADGLTISPSAAERIAKLKQIEGNDALMLRVSVSGGGCSGFQYGFTLEESLNDDDRVFESAGIRVVVDEISLDLLNGSRVNFVDDLIGSFFSIDNPNATSSCGCGTSFSI
jgi:iron-sulfur cluster insertion protein